MCENAPSSSETQKTSIYLPELVTILKKEKMTPVDSYFQLEMKERPLGHLPGQFAELSVPGIGEAPISVSSPPSNDKKIEMVIRNAGSVTNAIHSMDVGSTIGIRGPFGTSFPMIDLKGKNLLFICGGIGLVPARSAILYALQNRDDYKDISILFGCKDPSQRLYVNELEEWGNRDDITFHESVDTTEIPKSITSPSESWKGNVGVITTLLPKLKNVDPENTYAIIVGPPVMYKYVILNLSDMEFSDNHIILSLERTMKCGVGKCGHCQMNSIYVCQDGPVFNYKDIKQVREAI